MTAKILSFPEGKILPHLTRKQKERVEERIAREQTQKYANAVADEIVIVGGFNGKFLNDYYTLQYNPETGEPIKVYK